MMSTLEVCILCRHILYPGVGRRYKKYDAMTDLILRKCTPTAYVYACVIKYTGDVGKHTVCIACVNWTRSVLSTTPCPFFCAALTDALQETVTSAIQQQNLHTHGQCASLCHAAWKVCGTRQKNACKVAAEPLQSIHEWASVSSMRLNNAQPLHLLRKWYHASCQASVD
jgi:hypothetical protein